MSTERDNGLEALQRGDTALAISLLEQACQLEPNDFFSHLYLGAAYGQSNRHDEAVHSITRAVQLDPSSASARFNLGIALEHAGWPNEAITVFQQALVLQPDYPKASEALARLQASSPQTTVIPTAVPLEQTQSSPQPSGLGSYQSGGESTQPSYGSTSGYASQQPLPGAQQPAPTFQPPTGGMPGASPYGASPYPAATSNFNMRPVYEDSFSLKQAAKDWISVLKSPVKFFEEQVDREGLKAPMAFLVLFWTATIPFVLLGSLLGKGNIGTALTKHLTELPTVMIIGFVMALLYHIIGKMFGNSAAFSGSFRAAAYSQAPTFLVGLIAAVVIPIMLPASKSPNPFSGASAPTSRTEVHQLILVQSTNDGQDTQLSPPVSRRTRKNVPPPMGGPQSIPGMPGTQGLPGPSQNPFDIPGIQEVLREGMVKIPFLIVGGIWSFILLVIALSSIQRISSGAVVGTIIISKIIFGVIEFVLAMIYGIMVVAMHMGSGGMH